MHTPEIHLPPASEYSGTGRFGFSAQVTAATPFPNIGAAQSLRQLGRQTVNEQCHAEPLTQNEIDGADDVAAASARSTQVGGDHYTRMKLQPWDVCEATQTSEQFTGHLLATAQAYIMRFNTVGVAGKGGLQDVKKAHHTLARLIELLEGRK